MSQLYHFIGVAGIGMSALARLLIQRGQRVSGSDPSSSRLKEELRKLGAMIFDSQKAGHVASDALVVYSSDIAADNPELAAARSLGCRCLHRAELLAELVQQAPYSLAVTGTHGKTTTTAMLTTLLQKAGCQPSFAVGGLLLPERVNSQGHNTPHFVFEADESDGSMLRYHPYGAIITNIDSDHLLHYGSLEALEASMQSFAKQVQSQSHLLWCGDDTRLLNLQLPGYSYGWAEHCHFRISGLQYHGWRTTFHLSWQGRTLRDIEVALPGHHSVLNAAAACAMAWLLDLPDEAIRSGLAHFGGVERRLERLTTTSNVLAIDDYAHHPCAIQATLEALRCAIGQRRLIAIYQPHRYSRMTTLPPATFNNVFQAADSVYITDLYTAGEAPLPITSPPELCRYLAKREPKIDIRYTPHDQLLETLQAVVRPHDVVIALGAGDISQLIRTFAQSLLHTPPRKWRLGLTFGGPSPEHSISLVSAQFVHSHLDPDSYDVSLFGVTKQGQWVPQLKAITDVAAAAPETAEAPPLSFMTIEALHQCDLLFPIMHGPYGEDGIVQGLFEVLNKPYVGCNHRAAALCMDKAACKKIALHHGLATAAFVHFSSARWHSTEQKSLLAEIQTTLTFPMIIKASHIGSSIALGLANSSEELVAAIEEACRADDEVIVEQRLYVRDIEFAVLGDTHCLVLPPGEVLTNGKPYDYLDKVGPHNPATTPCASLPAAWSERGLEAARTIYHACGCQGWARVDFLLDGEGVFWFNEINPIPGMTALSLYPQICQQQGIAPKTLLDRLVVHALFRHRSQRHRQAYTPSLLPIKG